MYGSAIPRVTSKHPGPQPPPEISHCDCAGVNCTQKKAWRPLDGDLESSDLRRGSGSLFGIVYCLRRKQATQVAFAFLCLKGVREKSHNGGGQRAHTNSESDGESRRETRQLDETIVIEIVQERDFLKANVFQYNFRSAK